MFRPFRTLGLIGLLVAGTTTAAWADGTKVWDRYCSTGALRSCFSVTLTVENKLVETSPGVFQQQTWAKLHVLNLAGQYGSPDNVIIRRVSLVVPGAAGWTLWSGATMTGDYTGAASPSAFHGWGQDVSGDWRLNLEAPFYWSTGNNAIAGSCTATGLPSNVWCGDNVTIEFRLRQNTGVDPWTWDPSVDGTQLEVQYALGSNHQASANCTTADGSCAAVVPEPITLTLLGTGLLGLGGVGLARRRRERNVETT